MVSGVSIGAAATFSPHALANQNNTALVSVNIPEIVELSTNQVTVEAHLNGQAINNLQVGSVVVKSNAANGYNLTVTSVNNGLLKMTDTSQVSAVPYTLSYDTASGVSLRGTAEEPLIIENKTSANHDYLACATAAGCNRSLAINVKDSEANNKPAGIYRDILRFNIIAN